MIYCILFRDVSIIATKENVTDKNEPITWNAHTGYQDGYGGHYFKWRTGRTKQDAVWNLFNATYKNALIVLMVLNGFIVLACFMLYAATWAIQRIFT